MRQSHPSALLEDRIRKLLEQIGPLVHPTLVMQVTGLLDVGEHRIAIENLCELLCEDEVHLNETLRGELIAVAEAMGVDKRYSTIIP